MVAGGRELIDTLWNVNKCPRISEKRKNFRINRYIMECKCPLGYYRWRTYLELIDTLWNVNVHHVRFFTSIVFELIDTLWNVNSE